MHYLGLVQTSQGLQEVAEVAADAVEVLKWSNSTLGEVYCVHLNIKYESGILVDKSSATNRIVLKGGDVSLDGPLHVASGYERGGEIDVTVNEVGLQTDCVPGRAG